MRLNQIKLSGFKSFLESTTLTLNTPLTGIVGPNGCGKSNIVDAIRWVVGESSAKQLRGENLSDVIFGGSSSRKPVGKAQVELIFDNSAKRFGGRFSEYHEISIKREITRDSGSTYFLNQSPCRRRDIMDILLGTGLGPRSYAVIEQGMISHLISATPEELRSYLEEAAMVSKYKERRKEAESRIAHTRENILRIQDLSSEVEEQLIKVKAQAETAQTYREWKKSLQFISAQLEALEIANLQKKLKQAELAITEKEASLNQHLREETETDHEQERLTQRHHQEAEALSREQDEYYRFSIEISRLEQSLKDARTQNQRLQENLKQFEHNREHLSQQLVQDQKQHQTLQEQQSQNEPLLALRMTELNSSQNDLSESQGAWRVWQQQWDQFNKTAMQTQQSMEIKKNQLQQLQRLMDSVQHRYERLKQEKQQLQEENSGAEMAEWEEELITLAIKIEAQQTQIQNFEQLIQTKKQQLNTLEAQISQDKGKLQAFEAEQSSLKSLQKLALGEGKRHQAILEKIKQQGSTVRYLAESIKIAPKWEKALEVVLKDLLDGFCVDNIQKIASSTPLDSGLSLIEMGEILPITIQAVSARKLIHQMPGSNPLLEAYVSNIYIAETLEEAFEQLPELKAQESIITPEGTWLGPHWLKTPDAKDERSGMLARQQRLEVLTQEIQQQHTQVAGHTQQKTMLQEELTELKKNLEAAQLEKRRWMDQKTQIQANLNAKKNYLEQTQVRSKRAQEESEELEKQLNLQKVEFSEIQKKLEALRTDHEKNQQEEQRLQAQKRDLNHGFELAKTRLKNHENQVQQLKALIDSGQKQIQYLDKQILRTQEQIQGINQQYEWVLPQLSEIETALPHQEADLASYAEKRQASQARLQALKNEHQTTEQALNQLKNRYQEKKTSIDQLRKTLERLRIDYESANVQLSHHQEQINKLGFELEVVIQTLPKDANKSRWQEQQTILNKNIQSLGEINLAATQEYEELLKRKENLDVQSQDLTEGLNTLEEAIRKIDQETCIQLKNTFEQVNQNFMALFSKIFEGGQASLEMTETNWLSTGIVVKAQPKGKRNATIHLLSGGEKALTAIALVFAFFQLNPAPFCILDEVDAPLDDHNIARFCKLVEEMSNTLQFIFISHSKVTLTMAKQLVGVTMREAGVSRIVSVNIEEAIKLAQA